MTVSSLHLLKNNGYRFSLENAASTLGARERTSVHTDIHSATSKHALGQVVDLRRLELLTSSLQMRRSSQLSYRPIRPQPSKYLLVFWIFSRGIVLQKLVQQCQ